MSRQPFSFTCKQRYAEGDCCWIDHGHGVRLCVRWENGCKQQGRWWWCWWQRWKKTNLNLIMQVSLRCRFSFTFRSLYLWVGCMTLSSENHRLVSNAFLRWNGIFFLFGYFCFPPFSFVCCLITETLTDARCLFYWRNCLLELGNRLKWRYM